MSEEDGPWMQDRMNTKAGKGVNKLMNPRYTLLICMGINVERKRKKSPWEGNY